MIINIIINNGYSNSSNNNNSSSSSSSHNNNNSVMIQRKSNKWSNSSRMAVAIKVALRAAPTTMEHRLCHRVAR